MLALPLLQATRSPCSVQDAPRRSPPRATRAFRRDPATTIRCSAHRSGRCRVAPEGVLDVPTTSLLTFWRVFR
jgi:hypothetical protein